MLPGTLELLVLKLLSVEPLHGWGITQRLEQMSRHVLQVNQGSLYPALERLKRSGWALSPLRKLRNVASGTLAASVMAAHSVEHPRMASGRSRKLQMENGSYHRGHRGHRGDI
jgi:hypothetical protein